MKLNQDFLPKELCVFHKLMIRKGFNEIVSLLLRFEHNSPIFDIVTKRIKTFYHDQVLDEMKKSVCNKPSIFDTMDSTIVDLLLKMI